MLKEIWKVMLQVMLVVILVAMLGTATKLQTARNIKLQGAVSGNVDFDGSGNVIINTAQTNISVLTGDMTLIAASDGDSKTTTKDLTLPNGFTKDNCMVISQGIKLTASTLGFAFGSTSTEDPFVWQKGLLPYRTFFTSDGKLRIEVDNFQTTQGKISYKILLMKVS